MIKGSKFVLRTTEEKDIRELFDLTNDVQNRGVHYPLFLLSEPAFMKEFQETGFWDCEKVNLLLIVNESGKIIGTIHYFTSTPYYNGVEIGYILFAANERGKGIITEALTLFSSFLFRSKNINRLELKIFPENKASVRLAEKIGYKFEGISRGCVAYKGGHADLSIYALLREEFYRDRDKNLIL